MTRWLKKIGLSCIIILVAVCVEILNAMFFHNTWIWVLNWVYLIGLLTMVIGLFWNDEKEEMILLNDMGDCAVEGRMDAKTYLRKRYIDNELTDEEYTAKMSRL